MWKKTNNTNTPQAKVSEEKGNETQKSNRTSPLFPFLTTKQTFDENFEKICGFKLDDLTSFEKFVNLLYRPTDPASLGVCRALFGLCMVIDVVEERGFADIDLKWGDPLDCHFPLIHGMKPPTLPWMIVLYTIMWLGAFGIMLGLHFKIACACFVLPYWYIFSLDKSFWNNHTYLYGIVTILLWGTGANKYFALDAAKARQESETVPLWNYFILKFQFFALYFLAGLKKSSKEWLEGYAMTNLSRHWVFDPFKLFLSVEQTDYLIVHWFGFIFDLTVGFWMLFDKTRPSAMIFCTAFHFMNSRLFSIGMFPYACLATMPLFCHVDWPRKIQTYFTWNNKLFLLIKHKNEETSIAQHSQLNEKVPVKSHLTEEQSAVKSDNTAFKKDIQEQHTTSKDETNTNFDEKNDRETPKLQFDIGKSTKTNGGRKKTKPRKVTKKQIFVMSLLLCHIGLQFFLPYSHFITKGYNNWVPGLYGYSWDMMVHAWDTILVVIKIHDNIHHRDSYIDPEAWVQNDRWAKHGDMLRQYAFCIKENLMTQKKDSFSNEYSYKGEEKRPALSSNISIYMDVWSSLNGRFQQRMFNPNVDMLTVDWHPFKFPSYVMPLLTQYNSYRNKLEEIQQRVYNWSNYTDVLFVADFPGMHLENYITSDLMNVTLTVLEGEVSFSEEGRGIVIPVQKGSSIPVNTRKFHKITTTSSYPACYMYTYTNNTKQQLEVDSTSTPTVTKPRFSFVEELKYKSNAWLRVVSHIVNAFFYLVYNVPMIRRIRVNN